MKFLQVAQSFESIEKESSRTEITKLLAELYEQTTADESQIISYLSLGSLFPPYKTMQLNIAKKGMVQVLADLLDQDAGQTQQQFKELGDLGLVVQQGWGKHDSKVTVQEIYEQLIACAQISGIGSTDKKQLFLKSLLQQVDSLSAKFIVRIVTGTLRLGFSDMTLIDAFSWMEVGDKSLRKDLEHAYNVCADLGLVARTLKQDGIDAVKHMKIQVGIPIRPAAAERLANVQAVMDKLGPSVAQLKLDGFRLQVHKHTVDGKVQVNFFSRNLLDMSEMFPDLTKIVKQLPVDSLICEGEAIVYDEASEMFLPFQETVKRKRKHGVQKVSESHPLRLYVFDMLYLNGKSLLDQIHTDRRKILEQVVAHAGSERFQAIEEKPVKAVKELETYFLDTINAGLEGLIVRRENAHYQPGKRNFNWIKLKRHARGVLTDTIDCIILGYYHGKGKRTQFGIGAFLVGVYNKQEDRFQTVAKVGTGMKDEQWKELKQKCDAIERSDKPKRVDIAKDLIPDVWVQPDLVCVIQSEEITLSPVHSAGKSESGNGLALRFPRFISYRSDKSAEDATTVTELQSLYKQQKVE